MRKEKGEFLVKLSHYFDRQFRDTNDSIARGEISMKEIDKLKAVDELYRHATAIPVWPFNVHTVRRFAASVIFPVVIPILLVFLQSYFQE